MSGAKAATDADLQLFAAAVAHEIRTPLTALSGEIEVALRRDRSAEEYREVLRRIAAPLSDLVAITSDLALLSDPVDRSITGSRAARLDAILARLHDRFSGNRAMRIDALPAAHVQVAGDEQRLARALTLIIEHALRYRRPDSPLFVRVRDAGGLLAPHLELGWCRGDGPRRSAAPPYGTADSRRERQHAGARRRLGMGWRAHRAARQRVT